METIENNEQDKDVLTLEKAREILGDSDLTDERLNKIIEAVKVFCKISYELYLEEQDSAKIINLDNGDISHAA